MSPYLVLTRTAAIEVLDRITVAPCSTRIMPALKSSPHRRLGTLGPDAHADLCARLAVAFGCE